MNSRFTLAVALLLSTLPQISFSAHRPDSDFAAFQCDCRSGLQKLATSNTDVEVALAYLLSKEIPDKYSCPFDVRGRIQKAVYKYALERFVVGDSLSFEADLPSVGTVTLLTTDSSLEVLLVVLRDVLDKHYSAVLPDAARVFAREQVVRGLVWLLGQSHVEALLPNALADSGVYVQARNEVGRYFVDKGLHKLLD